MLKDVVKRALVALLMLFLLVFSSQSVSALTELRDDTDLTRLSLYQFKIKPENMEVISTSSDLIKDKVQANGSWKEADVFLLRLPNTQRTQSFENPLTLKFTSAGTVNGKVVDVYVYFNRVDMEYMGRTGEISQYPTKNAVPFLTLDENWGTNGLQIMDDIWPNHPNITYNLDSEYKTRTNVTVEYKYQDGSDMDLKMVMVPTDIDVVAVQPDHSREAFSLYDIENTIDKIVMNNRNVLRKTIVGNRTTWDATQATSGDDQEYNIAGLAVRSKTQSITFDYV